MKLNASCSSRKRSSLAIDTKFHFSIALRPRKKRGRCSSFRCSSFLSFQTGRFGLGAQWHLSFQFLDNNRRFTGTAVENIRIENRDGSLLRKNIKEKRASKSSRAFYVHKVHRDIMVSNEIRPRTNGLCINRDIMIINQILIRSITITHYKCTMAEFTC